MKRLLVAGNWKMNGDSASVASLLNSLRCEFEVGEHEASEYEAGEHESGEHKTGEHKEPPASRFQHCEVLIFPPHVYLAQVAAGLKGTQLKLGAQDVDSRDIGAVTGGVAAAMLRDIGCQFVILGHSERRRLFHEDNETIAQKFAQCVAHAMCPILCVGESREQRQAGVTLEVVTEQLEFVCQQVGTTNMRKAMVAYEPVWAIGTGESASPEEVEAAHAGIRAHLASIDAGLGANARLLYGGSVTPDNAPALLANEDVDGVLTGGASLSGESFLQICQAAEMAGLK